MTVAPTLEEAITYFITEETPAHLTPKDFDPYFIIDYSTGQAVALTAPFHATPNPTKYPELQGLLTVQAKDTKLALANVDSIFFPPYMEVWHHNVKTLTSTSIAHRLRAVFRIANGLNQNTGGISEYEDAVFTLAEAQDLLALNTWYENFEWQNK